ncbi:hypothetical protein IKD48_01550 [bacterium]|nr:hypothetical protein [bacterium]
MLAIVTTISLIGVILVAVLGPGNSLYFSDSQQITITFLNTDPNNINIANQIADAIKNQLHISSINSTLYSDILNGNYDQLLLVPNNSVNMNEIYPIVQSIDPN